MGDASRCGNTIDFCIYGTVSPISPLRGLYKTKDIFGHIFVISKPVRMEPARNGATSNGARTHGAGPNNALREVSLEARYERLEEILFSEMADIFNRIETFPPPGWRFGLDPVILAAQGLWYMGPGDTVRCYSCRLELSGWTRGMDVFASHIVASPNCEHLKNIFKRDLERIQALHPCSY